MANPQAAGITRIKALFVLFVALELVLASIFAVEILNLVSGLKGIADPTNLFLLGMFYTFVTIILTIFFLQITDKIRDVLQR